MQHYKIYLTPLSPIHIGCGEDFEPTNYIIDNNVLYHFEPSNMQLSASKYTDLLNRVNTTNLLSIQRFFFENKALAKSAADYYALVSPELAKNWQDKIGQVVNREGENNKVYNKLNIERTSYLPYSSQAYIPGSGFKGALATALLDNKHHRKGNPSVKAGDDRQLIKNYIGEFQDSELRFVKFSDFISVKSVDSYICYALNFKKKLTDKGGNGKGLPLRRECISAGQYRAFQSELSLWENPEKAQSLTDYFKILNNFYLNKILCPELKLLQERNLLKESWLKEILNLIQHYMPYFNSGKMALVRLGKNGAESKSYRAASNKEKKDCLTAGNAKNYCADSVAQIKIMKEKGQRPDFKNQATTVWLASDSSNVSTNLLPFGWAIIEIDDGTESSELKKWCDAQAKPQFDKAALIHTKQAKREALFAEQKKEKTKKLEAEKQEQEKIEMMKSLNENQLEVVTFVDNFNSSQEKQDDITSALLKVVFSLIERAVADWSEDDRLFLHQQITLDLVKSRINFRKKDGEKNMKKALNKLTVTQ